MESASQGLADYWWVLLVLAAILGVYITNRQIRNSSHYIPRNEEIQDPGGFLARTGTINGTSFFPLEMRVEDRGVYFRGGGDVIYLPFGEFETRTERSIFFTYSYLCGDGIEIRVPRRVADEIERLSEGAYRRDA